MKPITISAALCMLWLTFTSTAQTKIDRNKFTAVDKYVADLGPMEGNFLKFIVDTLTHRRSVPQMEQVRAMYMWEAHNISFNTSARRHPKQANNTASEVLNERSATAEGYANLFKAMCDMAQIYCEVIPGMAKFDARDIGKLNQKWDRHTWNAVKIDNTWYLLDIAWSAGYTDRKFRFYTKSFTDAWFLADRELFALNHYPDKKPWQLLDSPINKSNFTYAPIVGASALIYGVYPEAIRGNVRGKADTTKKMVFEVDNPELIKSISVTRRTTEKIPVKYTIEGNKLYADVPFNSMGEYPFNIYVNDQLAYTYRADIGKPKKKRVPPKPVTKSKKAVEKKAAEKKTAVKKTAAPKEKMEAAPEEKQVSEKADKKKGKKERKEKKKKEEKENNTPQ